MIPSTLSHYRVLEKIGAGGMGVVYRAHDEQLDRDVALKVLPTGMLADEGARRRFRNEALALARLNHPNIGGVYEFGNQEGFDFLVMELISGVAIDSKISGGPLPQSDVLRLGTQLADGLHAAHTAGIVHRDLKPSNLRLTGDGRLKILDFGLAEWAQTADDNTVTQTFTRTDSSVSGTVPYMAPEQLRGKKCDARTDIYSAGVVLYEMSTGKRPYGEASGPQLIGAILEQAPSPPSTHNRHLSPALESILMKALDKDPERRYQSARELRIDLERLSSGMTPVYPRRQRSRGVAVGAAGVGALVLGLALYLGWHHGRASPPPATVAAVNARRSVAVLGFKNLSGKPDEAWISTALSEMLGTELAAGEKVRTVPGENVARMKSDLALTESDSFAQDTLSRIRKNLGTDLVVVGSYLALGQPAQGKIRLDLRLQDTRAGETIASFTETGTEGEMLDLVSRTGADLRRKLGIENPAEPSEVQASFPSNAGAARLYSSGLAKLRVFEAQDARAILEKAVAADPGYAPAHTALADAWSTLGYDAKARQESKKAFELSNGLSREEKLDVEARYRAISHEWPKAIEIYKTLWAFFPDNAEYGLRLASAQIAGGSAQDALTTVQQLRQNSEPDGEDARISLAESKAAGALGDFHRAQQAAADAATKGRTQGGRLVVAQARLMEGYAWERLGQSAEASAAFAEAQSLFSAAGDKMGAAQAVHQAGSVLYDKGDFAGARKNYEQAASVFQQLGNKFRAASSLNNLGNVSYERGELARARQYYQQRIAAFRDIDDKAGLAGGLGNLANVMDSMGELAGALNMNREALAAFQAIGDQRGAASTLDNLGNVQNEMGDLAGARQNFEEALRLQNQNGYKRGAAYALFGLADVLASQGNLAEARTRAEQCTQIRRELGEQVNLALSNDQLAFLAMEEGRLEEAENLVRTALQEFEKAKIDDNSASTYGLLTLILLQEHKTGEAQNSARQALIFGRKSSSHGPRFDAEIAHARALAATGERPDAIKSLQALTVEAKKYGYLGYEYEGRLAAAEIQMSTDRVAGMGLAAALEKQARDKGFVRIANQAAKLRT
jgi:serine/threonine protein kinase/tetratricopeptide (TPR) repeat protein